MVRQAEKRTGGAKAVAAERKYPLPIRCLIMSYHEDEEGNQGEPAVIRAFRVTPYTKTIIFVDNQCVEHRYQAEPGELDWTSGMVCVKEEEYDEQGNLLLIHPLSHEMQRRPNSSRSDFRAGKIVWTRGLSSSPNAVKARVSPVAKKPAGIIAQWQAQADSPDAYWLDGAPPTEEQVAAAQKEYEEKRAANQRGAQTNAPQTQPEPQAVAEGGDDFDEFG
jgi:hypothetical protein